MIRKLILQLNPLPLESVKIGSLITDPLHPNEDTENGSTPQSLEIDCTASRSGPRLELINESSNTSIVVKLLSSLFSSFENSGTLSQTIVADDTCTYELNNPNRRFEDITSQEEVQSWIQKQKENGQTIYFITGIQTTLNQRVETSKNSKLSSSGFVSFDPSKLPIGKALNADDSNSDIKASHSRSKDTELSLSPTGERVVAIRIRRVDVNEATKATMDQKNRSIWKMVGDQRAETSVEQLVEAVLQEEDDDCGGTTEVLNAGDGDEKFVYVALEGSDKAMV